MTILVKNMDVTNPCVITSIDDISILSLPFACIFSCNQQLQVHELVFYHYKPMNLQIQTSLPAKDINSKFLTINIIERQISYWYSLAGRGIIDTTSTLSFTLLIGIPERILAMQWTERLRVLFLEESLSAHRTGNHRTYLWLFVLKIYWISWLDFHDSLAVKFVFGFSIHSMSVRTSYWSLNGLYSQDNTNPV